MNKAGVVFVIVVLATILLAVSGSLTIWALNTLFAFSIPYTINTITAAAILAATVYGAGGAKSKS